MRSHINQRAAAALREILPPRAGNRWIPAGQLGAPHDRSSQGARLHELPGLLVIDIVAHAKAECKQDVAGLAGMLHLGHFGLCQGDRFFAENMFPSLGGLDHLPRMRLRRGSDIDGIEVAAEQFCF